MYKTPKLKNLKSYPWITDVENLKKFCRGVAEGSEKAGGEGCLICILPGDLSDLAMKYTSGDVFNLAEVMSIWFREHKHEAVISLEQSRDTEYPGFWATYIYVYRDAYGVAHSLWKQARKGNTEICRILDQHDTSKGQWITKQAAERLDQYVREED